MKKLIVVLFAILFSTQVLSDEVKIVFKINDKIITNQDIEIEYNYLTLLNKNLENLSENDLRNYAKQSNLNELIKKIELEKYSNLTRNSELIEQTIKDIYRSLNITNIEDFEEYLASKNLNLNIIEKKIQTETMWNQLIYLKYKNRLNIDEEKIREDILNNKSKSEKVLLQEIVYKYKDKNDLEKKYKEIVNHINLNDFKDAVLKYSVSESKKNNGNLDWVYLTNIVPIVKKNIETLNKDQISKPIIIPGGALIIKMIEREFINENIDIEKKLTKNIQDKINQQLNNFSRLYFNKISNDLKINEY
jgi:peptidyl-prolyl cis-trans isomerase SurA